MKNTETNISLSAMKAQVNGKKKHPVKVSKQASSEKQKAAIKENKAKVAESKKKKAIKVSTDVKAKKEKAEKVPKIAYETLEAEVAKMLGVNLVDDNSKDKLRRVGETKAKSTLVSMPERKELVIKIAGKNICEIYPRKGVYKICTRQNFIEKVNLPDNVVVNHHEKWDMTEQFNLTTNEVKPVLEQFSKLKLN